MNDDADTYRWLAAHPDECAAAVADAYSGWTPGDGRTFAELLAQEIQYQQEKARG